LIFDEIYDFVEFYTTIAESKQDLLQYAAYQRQKAVIKYGFKPSPQGRQAWKQHHSKLNENIVNKPNMALHSKDM